ncbi:MAG: hypothetical protein NC131_10240 [Roseburia sp.]|nr:hypothetical protein [Roseburia sp.]
MTTKKTITIKAGKILGALGMIEGSCAAVLVDKGLKMIPMNPIVKYIGRSAVSALVQLPFAAAGSYLWASDELDIKIPYGKERLLHEYELTDEKCKEICNELENMEDYEIEELDPTLKLNAIHAIKKLLDSHDIDEKKAEELLDSHDIDEEESGGAA